MRFPQRVKALGKLAQRNHFPEYAASLLILGSITFGAAMAVVPEEFTRIGSFRVALAWTGGSTLPWAAAFLLNGFWLMFALAADKRIAYIGSTMMTAIWTLWALGVWFATSTAAPSAMIMYMVAAWLSAGLTALYWGEREH